MSRDLFKLDSLLNHPAVQSGIIPFIIALALLLILGKIKPAILGVAAIAAFAATVGIVKGFSLLPLASTNKIILVAYLAAALGLTVDVLGDKLDSYRKVMHGIYALLAIISVIWVIWPVVSRESTQNPLGIAVGLSAYVAWMVFGMNILQPKKIQVSAAIFAMATGTAIVSIIGATALYGQLAAPFAAATGAWLLWYLFSAQKGLFSTSFSLAASITCAVLGAAATVYASLPWLTLVLLALIPLVVHIPVKQNGVIVLRVLKLYIAALIPVIAAVWYTARQSADSGYYG